ncbi:MULTISPECIES: hypothetical protein [unclassified Campylobacter]|uniref:hypothetical protein n=1 Tax=unclassified Campylobacter TaxID=2593542 RepID=UPI001D40960D|nr:hypothetical protein [Campylobacter sp. RM12651]MBZ7983883.1 hypothetical protein [Campylobacter sp. RM12647]MBZ7992376.1 hypothetical protein [Campylobacter sp. RM9333]ULO04387.1 hypothetical protein AVBRAN_1952 [Campylobacter sp. RM12651]
MPNSISVGRGKIALTELFKKYFKEKNKSNLDFIKNALCSGALVSYDDINNYCGSSECKHKDINEAFAVLFNYDLIGITNLISKVKKYHNSSVEDLETCLAYFN